MAGNYGRAFSIATGKQALELGHHVTPLGIGGLVACLTIRLQDGPDLAIITYFRSWFGLCLFAVSRARTGRDEPGKCQKQKWPSDQMPDPTDLLRRQIKVGGYHQPLNYITLLL